MTQKRYCSIKTEQEHLKVYLSSYPPNPPVFFPLIRSQTFGTSTSVFSPLTISIPDLFFTIGVGSSSPLIMPIITRTARPPSPSPHTPKNPEARATMPMTTVRNKPDSLCRAYTSVEMGLVAKSVDTATVACQRRKAPANATADPAAAIAGLMPFKFRASSIFFSFSSSVSPFPSTLNILKSFPGSLPLVSILSLSAFETSSPPSFSMADSSSARRRALTVFVLAEVGTGGALSSSKGRDSSSFDARRRRTVNRKEGMLLWVHFPSISGALQLKKDSVALFVPQ
mmetsp:Transcript_28673/g.65517  ORF Transcript_28673/g.65517 Transcript_28673/m.65517 type:complete len:284 (+) Transcript_28673:161-1012(+)